MKALTFINKQNSYHKSCYGSSVLNLMFSNEKRKISGVPVEGSLRKSDYYVIVYRFTACENGIIKQIISSWGTSFILNRKIC